MPVGFFGTIGSGRGFVVPPASTADFGATAGSLRRAVYVVMTVVGHALLLVVG